MKLEWLVYGVETFENDESLWIKFCWSWPDRHMAGCRIWKFLCGLWVGGCFYFRSHGHSNYPIFIFSSCMNEDSRTSPEVGTCVDSLYLDMRCACYAVICSSECSYRLQRQSWCCWVQMKVLWLLSIRQRFSCTVNCETEKDRLREMGWW
jgi:hypothetical protein